MTTHNIEPTSGSTGPQDAGRTSLLWVMLAWIVVGIPLAWGVSQTIIRSLELFRAVPVAHR
ncbi:MAG: MFS transporter small subunit [Bacillota bacterium]